MELTRVDGVKLAYEVSGAGEPVVLIHGALIADTFRPLLSRHGLADRYQLILYHRRGYGDSGSVSGPMSIVHGAADCRALLSHLGVKQAHVVGHSYGGAIALQMALAWPDVVHSLTLLEPALMVGQSSEGYRAALARGVERYVGADTTVVVDEFLQARWPGPGYRVALDSALPGAFDQAVEDAATWFEREAAGLLGWRFGEADALLVSQPTLSVLGGESNALWSRFGETHRLLLRWLPRAEGLVVPGTTHFMLLQDPRVVAEGLASFWERNAMQNTTRSR